jgi:hypothetical protein
MLTYHPRHGKNRLRCARCRSSQPFVIILDRKSHGDFLVPLCKPCFLDPATIPFLEAEIAEAEAERLQVN